MSNGSTERHQTLGEIIHELWKEKHGYTSQFNEATYIEATIKWLEQKKADPKPQTPLNSKAKLFYDAKEVVLQELIEELSL